MSGVKGRSGRKSKSDEAKRLAIIEKSWDTISAFLDSDAKLKDRVDVAIKVAVKDMPADTILDQSEHNHITVVIKTDDNANAKDHRNRVLFPQQSENSI